MSQGTRVVRICRHSAGCVEPSPSDASSARNGGRTPGAPAREDLVHVGAVEETPDQLPVGLMPVEQELLEARVEDVAVFSRLFAFAAPRRSSSPVAVRTCCSITSWSAPVSSCLSLSLSASMISLGACGSFSPNEPNPAPVKPGSTWSPAPAPSDASDSTVLTTRRWAGRSCRYRRRGLSSEAGNQGAFGEQQLPRVAVSAVLRTLWPVSWFLSFAIATGCRSRKARGRAGRTFVAE